MNDVDTVNGAFLSLINSALYDLPKIGTDIPIPSFEKSIVLDVLNIAKEMLAKEDTMIAVRSPVNVVGDLHGSLQDLLRILATLGNPKTTKYLFLGDYVDRGPLSVEVILLLLSMYVSYPGNISLIRGNHEFSEICSVYGFKEELMQLYNDNTVFEKFIEVFSYLPLAATIDEKIFCTHGGIAPTLHKADQIFAIKRPIHDYSDPIIKHLVWADPTNLSVQFIASDRSGCQNYGVYGATLFFQTTGYNKIFRAHQCVKEGVMWNNPYVATIFSSSNYSPLYPNNRSGVIIVNGIDNIEEITFEPIKKIERTSAEFFYITKRDGPARKFNVQIALNTPSGGLFNTKSTPSLTFKTGHSKERTTLGKNQQVEKVLSLNYKFTKRKHQARGLGQPRGKSTALFNLKAIENI